MVGAIAVGVLVLKRRGRRFSAGGADSRRSDVLESEKRRPRVGEATSSSLLQIGKPSLFSHVLVPTKAVGVLVLKRRGRRFSAERRTVGEATSSSRGSDVLVASAERGDPSLFSYVLVQTKAVVVLVLKRRGRRFSAGGASPLTLRSADMRRMPGLHCSHEYMHGRR